MSSKFFVFIPVIILSLISGCGKQSKIEVKKQKVGDVELAYYTRGSGEPLLMVMGFRGTMAIWDPALIEELSKKFTVIVFDNRGVGLSSDTKENKTTIEQMTKDTIGLIQALGYQKVHLLGWSMGSMIAMQLAIDHPEILKTLILCSPNPEGVHAAQRKTDAFARLTAPNLSDEEALSLIYPQTAEGRIAATTFIVRLTKAIHEGWVPNDLKISPETVQRQVRVLKLRENDNSLYEKLASIRVPTLVTGGLSDVLDLPENTRTVANQIPFAWAAYFPQAGHAFASQDYQLFSQLVTLFIEAHQELHASGLLK